MRWRNLKREKEEMTILPILTAEPQTPGEIYDRLPTHADTLLGRSVEFAAMCGKLRAAVAAGEVVYDPIRDNGWTIPAFRRRMILETK